jgi:hypothetical protein
VENYCRNGEMEILTVKSGRKRPRREKNYCWNQKKGNFNSFEMHFGKKLQQIFFKTLYN